MTDKPRKTREELALGVLHPRTGKRKGGYIEMYRPMRQYREKMATGEMSEDDLIEMAFQSADKEIARQLAGPDQAPVTFDEEDAEYAVAQAERYRREYDWDDSNANDDAGLTMLIEYEVQSRRMKRDLLRANIPWKERVELLGELRQLGNTHVTLQKSLLMDKATRDSRTRNQDPMDALREQILDGNAKLKQLMAESEQYAAQADTLEELRALWRHSWAIPGYALLDVWLMAYDRVEGRKPSPELLRLAHTNAVIS